ncbi:MAG: SirB2 family protein [Moraxella sp.]|nr:SirB2 family protein [Moraxella sp.]
MKHFHLLMMAVTLALFMLSSYRILTDKPANRALFITSHVVYLLVVATGLVLLYPLWQAAGVQHWAIAKIILLIVAISAMIKARKNQGKPAAKAGIFVAAVAVGCLLGFAIFKPILG